MISGICFCKFKITSKTGQTSEENLKIDFSGKNSIEFRGSLFFFERENLDQCQLMSLVESRRNSGIKESALLLKNTQI